MKKIILDQDSGIWLLLLVVLNYRCLAGQPASIPNLNNIHHTLTSAQFC